MRRSLRCLPLRNICWLHYIMVPETLVLLLEICVTANLIVLTNSGTVKEESISIASAPPYSKKTQLDQLKKGRASRDVRKNTWATNDTSVKDSKPVKTFDKQANRAGTFPSRYYTTLGILVREPAPSGLGLTNRRRSVLGKDMARTRRLTKRNASKRNGENVELGKKSKEKREVGANVKKVRKKRVKRTKKPGQTRNYKELLPKATKPVLANTRMRNDPNNGKPHKKTEEENLKGPIVKSSEAQSQGAMQETIHESQKQVSQDRRRRQILHPNRRIFYYDDMYDNTEMGEKVYENNIYNYKAYDAEEGEAGEGEIAEYNDDDPGPDGKSGGGGSKGGSKGKGKGGSKGKGKGGSKGKGKGGSKGKGKGGKKKKKPREAAKSKEFDMNLESKSGKRTKRDNRKWNEKRELDVQSKRTDIRSINRTPPHRLVLNTNSNKTAASVAAGKQGNPEATRGKRTTPTVTVKRPTPPVFLTLCSDKVCANGGTCLRSAIRGIICICPTGYSGKTCDNRLDPCNRHPCQNGATCTFAAKTQPMRCQCPAGFTGQLCQIDVTLPDERTLP